MARAWLEERGYASTLDYLRAVAIRVIEETGLLPHLNPGVMSWEEMARLKHVSASMGMMLETSSDRLSRRAARTSARRTRSRRPAAHDRGRRPPVDPVHHRHPGRDRRDAPRAGRVRSFAIRSLHLKYRHVQEVIVQNFRAKPGTAMHRAPEPGDDELLATVAVARILFGPRMNVQAPPNLSDPAYPRLIDAGINDWGGVSPVTIDHVNPEAPWPRLEDLKRRTAEKGHELHERLAIYPEYAPKPDPWLAGKMQEPVRRLVGRRRSGGRRADPRADAVAGPRGPVEAAADRAHVRQGRRRRAPRGRRRRLRRLRPHRGHPGMGAPGPDGARAPGRRDPRGPGEGVGRAARRHHLGRGARAVPGRGRPPWRPCARWPTTCAARRSATR